MEDVLYMNFCNDISFGIEDKVMVFGEHQSTINENMPLRDLLYIGRALEQIVPVRDRYRKKAVRLPTPEFYTFYNGKEPWARVSLKVHSDNLHAPLCGIFGSKCHRRMYESRNTGRLSEEERQ